MGALDLGFPFSLYLGISLTISPLSPFFFFFSILFTSGRWLCCPNRVLAARMFLLIKGTYVLTATLSTSPVLTRC